MATRRMQLLLVLLVMATCVALASAHSYSDAPKKDVEDDGYKKPKEDVEDGHYPRRAYGKPEDEDDDNEPNGEPNDDVDNKYKPAPYKPFKVPQLVSLAVQGVVLCQDCRYVGTKSLADAKPLPGAKVKLFCRSRPGRYKAFFYTTATTDENGFFYLRVPHFNFKQFTPVDDCAIILVSSPSRQCSKPTYINYGKIGAQLRPIPTFAPSSEAFFSAGPLAFAPRPCVKLPPIKYPPPSPTTSKNPPPYASPAPTTTSPPPHY